MKNTINAISYMLIGALVLSVVGGVIYAGWAFLVQFGISANDAVVFLFSSLMLGLVLILVGMIASNFIPKRLANRILPGDL